MTAIEPGLYLRGNEPIALQDLGAPLSIETGAVAVFAIRVQKAIDNGKIMGHRRFLFQVDPGDVLIPMPDAEDWKLVAIPLQGSRARDCSPDGPTPDKRSVWRGKLARSVRLNSWPSERDNEITEAFFAALSADENAEEKQRRSRFELRQRMDGNGIDEAIRALAGIEQLTGEQPLSGTVGAVCDRPSVDEDFLSSAIRAVAAVHGIAITLAPESDRAEDPVHALAESSHFRIRRVLLRAEWYRAENGPLLARLKEGDRPVALLPAKSRNGSRYTLFDPLDRSRKRVDANVASTINPEAIMFYRPLPDNTSVRSLLRFALSPYAKDLIRIPLLSLGVLGLTLAAPLANLILFNQAIPYADRTMVWEVAAALIAAATAAGLLAYGQNFQRVQGAAFMTLQTGIWDRLLRLPPAFFRRFTAGELRLRADRLTAIQTLLSGDAIRTVCAGAFSFLIVPILLYYSSALGALSLGAGLLALGATWFGCRSLWRLQDRALESEGLLSGLVLQIIAAVPKLRVAGAERRAFAQWALRYRDKQILMFRIQAVKDAVHIVNATLTILVSACSFAYMLSAAGQKLPLGSFLAYYAAIAVFLVALTQACDAFMGLVATGNLWKQSEPILVERPEVDPVRAHPGKLRGGVFIDNVTFRYRTDGPLTLDRVSIKAEPGECIALTGPSGGGKTTVVHLLLGFELPHSGAIYLDGQELSSLDIAAVRRQIGVVTQNGKILSRSVYDNICSGGTYTMDEAWDAARAAGLAEDIEAMPMGMHTRISEGGGNISGGQRQRLLIARALVLKPRIVIFDEATSALDNRTQAVVAESLARLDATRIVIAHRLSTIRSADRIYVIENGRVAQQGTYPELVSQAGLFAKLAGRQT